MGKLAVFLALGLMGMKFTVWFLYIRSSTTLAGNISYCIFTGLMIWTYLWSMFLQPSSSPSTSSSTTTSSITRASNQRRFTSPASASSLPSALSVERYCERCDRIKPPYTHHCSHCQRCIYRMDHHCPWTNNCIGWENKKFFILFLLYTSLCCLLFNGLSASIVWNHELYQKTTQAERILLQLTWFLTLGIGGVLGGYFVFHLWLLAQGKTTLEILKRVEKGELEGHSFTHNVRVYFGINPWLWLVPIPQKLLQEEVEETQQLMV